VSAQKICIKHFRALNSTNMRGGICFNVRAHTECNQ